MRSLIFLLLLSFNATAALYDRGNGLIYDDVLDITWLQDANYASTTGYSNYYTNQWYNSSIHSGGMYWSDAVVFVDQLDYAGFNHWRLPSIKSSGEGYNQYNSELGHMFYNNLNNDCTLPCSSVNSAFTDTSTGLEKNFSNLVGFQNEGSNGGLYWFSEELDGNPIRAWAFWTNSNFGFQSSDHKESYDFIWPVHDGDIGASPVPLPAGIYLFLSGLVGLVGAKLRGRSLV